MIAREFLTVRSAGPSTLNESSCVVESAELERTGDRSDAGQPGDCSRPADNGHDVRAREASRPWHPYEALDEWAERLDPRSRAIFLARVSGNPLVRPTLKTLAAEFGVSRERIRQIEVRVRRSLETFLSTDEADPVRSRATTLRQELGVAAPTDVVTHLLRPPSGFGDHRAILLEMAGPYDHERGWYTLRSARAGDPTSSVLAQVDEVGRIDSEIAGAQLADWGLRAEFHDRWLARVRSVRLFNGQPVLWGTSIPDRFIFALADMGRPATIDEMVNHVGEKRSRESIGNALTRDPRLLRVSRAQWGLASWGLPEYSGVADSMRGIVQQSGGAIPVEDMVRVMEQTFGVVESTTMAYCNAPLFVVEGDLLRLRDHDSEPFIYSSDSFQRTPGFFHLGPMRLARLVKVNANVIRGSGASLTHAAGALLEIDVNSHLSFSNRHGDRVDVTFPESSLIGPTIGSIRRLAERLSAEEGQYLTLVIDRTDMSVTGQVTDLGSRLPGWDVVGSLTGIDAPVDLDGLARTLHCAAGEVRSVLDARGDDEVLAFLPKSDCSAGVDDALAAFEDRGQRVPAQVPHSPWRR